jgi:hypothetical protein
MEWVIALLLIGAMFWMLSRDYQQKQSRTTEDYEEAVRSGEITGQMVSAGLLELQKVFEPSTQAAQEFVQDEKQGQTKTEKEGDTPPDAEGRGPLDEEHGPTRSRE